MERSGKLLHHYQVTKLSSSSASITTKCPTPTYPTSSAQICFVQRLKMSIRNMYLLSFYILHKVFFFYSFLTVSFLQNDKKQCLITPLEAFNCWCHLCCSTDVCQVFLMATWRLVCWTHQCRCCCLWWVDHSSLYFIPVCAWSVSPRTDMKNIYGLTCGAISPQHKLSWLSACSPKINFDVSSSKSALIKYLLAYLI